MSRTNKDGPVGHALSLSRERVAEILQQVRYLHYVWEVGGTDRIWLRANFYAKDASTGEIAKQYTRRWYVSRHTTRSEVVQTALKCVLTSVEHEVRENFLYRGRAIFCPHFDVDELVRLVDAGHFSTREGAKRKDAAA